MNTENTNIIELKDSDLEQVEGAFGIGGLRLLRRGYGYGYGGGLGLGLGLGLFGWDEGCGGGYPGFYGGCGGGYPGFYEGGCY
ncbi:hypothetical protein [Dictyobacter formicarum]|uniref:Bacteriocin n=1 Tax=Dictyobacter formicarum TaxID=2778368 RepID=A0ABQ3VA10_9CHLR|nr:hypothetical protein [Dictyobacter formicarum]GHO82066.1 hypothetical protein KSZ_00720 [Dictyobacter formicarum]